MENFKTFSVFRSNYSLFKVAYEDKKTSLRKNYLKN